jgi:hypothetical protein
MAAAIQARLSDTGPVFTYTAPAGYGAWTDTGTVKIAKGIIDENPGCTPASDSMCGLASTTTTLPINLLTNTVVSVVPAPVAASPEAAVTAGLLSAKNFWVTFSPALPAGTVQFKNAAGVTGPNLVPLSVIQISSSSLQDASGNALFALNGNMTKAISNFTLIQADKSLGIHNPPFVSAVLAATADPFGNPNATPPQPGGLWY